MSSEEAEARSPYASPPQTSSQYRQQQQQQQNNARRVSAQYWDREQQQWVSGERPIQQERQQQQQLTYQQQAELNAQQRPGYTELSQLGDQATQQFLFMTDTQRQVFGQMGIQMASKEQMAGNILEAQRQAAYKTPGTKDERFYGGELQKWGERKVEVASAYHNVGMKAGEPIPANPWEYQADLAVEFLKGRPVKSSEFFSPVSGEMSPYLPGGEGLQQYAWREAVAKDRGLTSPEQISFTDAINKLNAAEGKYGPYGRLAGGIDNGYAIINRTANRQAGTMAGTDVFSKANTNLPPGVFFTGAIEKVEPGKTEEPRAFSFGGIISDFTKSFEQLKQGDIFGGIGLYSQGLSRYSTRAAMPNAEGFGKYVEERDTSQSPVGTVVTGAAYIGETIYSDIRKDPVMDVFLYGLPFGFKYGESLIGGGVARAATSGSKVLSTGGRLLSTPAAKTWGSLAKAGLVGLYAFQSGVNVWEAPNTPKGKGEALGHVGYQVGMMAAGIPLAASYTPAVRENPFESRTFFTGERKLPLSEKVMIRASDLVNSLSQTKGQKAAIRDISTEYMGKSASFTKPEITTVEPDLSKLTHVGENAPQVKAAMAEQPSVLYGGGSIEAQIGTGPAAMKLRTTALPSADADIFAEFPDIMKAEAGEIAARGMDIHTFPEGYPDVGQTANAQVQPGSYLFGNRYKTNPYIDEITQAGRTEEYTGETSFEQLNVGFRKLSSAVRDDIAAPMEKGYRLGKDVSRLTRVRDVLEEVRVSSDANAKPIESAFNDMLKQTITYNEQLSKGGQPNIRTDTLENIRARYEGNPKQNIQDTFSKYTKGVISSIGSAIAPGSLGSVISSRILPPSSSSSPASRLSPSSSQRYYEPSRISYTPPSNPPSRPSSIQPRTTNPFTSNPPTSRPPSTPSNPPPSPPQYTPPSNPPTKPPSSPPPKSPPSSIPYYPPYTPPPTTTPFGGLPFAGESPGSRSYLRMGLEKWSNLNPVADIPYLSKGLGDPFSPKGGMGGGAFGAKCRHINPKLRRKCSRFLRNG